jgi:hypothetical protein
MRPRHAATAALVTIVVTVILGASPAVACGGLVGENGTIRLDRTTTLAGYHDGVEHYITSFSFTGEGKEVGSIIPLPGVPTLVERAGDWTLQRLEREVTPIRTDEFQAADASIAAPKAAAQVLLQTQVDALDITILKGGGAEVGKWALDHGFFLSPDAPEVLDDYSRRSPIFMAARFDAAAAQARGQQEGDGTPIHLAIPTTQPWVPLRILGLGLPATTPINADVFLLTDSKPQLLAGPTGLTLERSEVASDSLMQDLRSDKNSGWIPPSAWLTYLKVNSTAGDLHYDLATSVTDQQPSRVAADLDITPDNPVPGTTFTTTVHSDVAWLSVVAVTAVLFAGIAIIALIADRDRGRHTDTAS